MTDEVPPWARPRPSPETEPTADRVEADMVRPGQWAGGSDQTVKSTDRPLFPPPSGPAAPLFPGGAVRQSAPTAVVDSFAVVVG